MDINYKGKISSDIYVQAGHLAWTARKGYIDKIAYATVAASILLGGFLFYSSGHSHILILALALVVLIVLVRYSLRPWALRSVYGKNKSIVATPFTGRITDQGIELKQGQIHVQQPWTLFKEFYFNDQLFILFTDERVYQITHKSFFETDEDWNSVLKLVQSKLKVGRQ